MAAEAHSDGASEPQRSPERSGGRSPQRSPEHTPGRSPEHTPGRTSRRFPMLTRDTARPEGGGRAASGDYPAPARQWPLLVVMGGVALGLLLVALDVFRIGAIIVGLSLLAGAGLRWAVPSVGMLAVRSRFTDMATYGLLGFVTVMLALMVQPKPWLRIPFLDDIVHFTV
ncbi:hypothetical protein SSP35_01_03200 [Streptomyces sp. NBRC 110611]|uniref:DUF3017 domain-containing protein n=1 Tax=Streptomyces sp. NBRC 110611 TaxID=1621259 RepID=UPI000856C4A9|nr:DUF3017 domain-containing protein [Streptomyces sp. NBRC 110611]GAU64983.1 hypothetical protein SSP35_01_03200 [Streptomyces sp. NBRC 110611]